MKGLEQRTGRRFVFAEEDGEVVLSQAARQIGGVAVSAARRRTKSERDKNVVPEEARSESYALAQMTCPLVRLCPSPL